MLAQSDIFLCLCCCPTQNHFPELPDALLLAWYLRKTVRISCISLALQEETASNDKSAAVLYASCCGFAAWVVWLCAFVQDGYCAFIFSLRD